jgi:hypothetical protein
MKSKNLESNRKGGVHLRCWTAAWLGLALAGVAAPTRTWAAAAPVERVAQVERASKNRLHVLVVGPSAGEAGLAELQTRLGDLAWVYRAPVTGGSDTVLADLDRWLGERAWNVIVLDLGRADLGTNGGRETKVKALRSIAGKVLASGAACIWVPAPVASGADGAAASVAYNDALRSSLRERGVWVQDDTPFGRKFHPAAEAEGLRAQALASRVLETVTARNGPFATLPIGEKRDPARLLAVDGALADPTQLRQVPAQTATVYRAEAGQWQFNLHSYLAFHDGRFWAIWSSGRVDEDSSSQLIRYATSQDGLTWSLPETLAADPDGESGPWRWMASGVHVEGGKLVALGSLNQGFQGDKIWAEAQLVRFEWTGSQWQRTGIVARDCVLYYPPIQVAGRDFVVWRNEYAHFATAYRRPDADTWEVTRIPGPFPDYRLSETSHYVDPDGVVHLVIRDQGASGYLYHALSFDAGATWTIPVKTNYPDAMSKNFADRLSNGWYYLISNPKHRGGNHRDPLAISFSRDGWSFGDSRALRLGAPPLRYKGGAKGPHSFQYSHALEHAGRLWVIYATNKEDIEVSSYRIEDFGLR